MDIFSIEFDQVIHVRASKDDRKRVAASGEVFLDGKELKSPVVIDRSADLTGVGRVVVEATEDKPKKAPKKATKKAKAKK